jgi:hypothetical protein
MSSVRKEAVGLIDKLTQNFNEVFMLDSEEGW